MISLDLKNVFKEKLKAFSLKKIMVVGDLMVDEYIIGKVSRISPEAPVAVLNYKEKKIEVGGAGNVALNIKKLGAEVCMVGVASEDEKGLWLRKHLAEHGIRTEGIFAEELRPTTVKTRFATKGQQLLRMDNEDSHCIKEETQDLILTFIKERAVLYDAVIISDYKKGVFNNEEFVREIIRLCNVNNTLISIDSKSRNIEAFANADFVKPNNLELEEAVGIKIEDDVSLNKAGEAYLERSQCKTLIVTRGAKGISIFEHGKTRQDYASKAHDVFDVTGAGDTVISTITLGMTSGLSMAQSVQLANLAASVVISKVGTAVCSQQELEERINAE